MLKVKICGIRTSEAAEAATVNGADFLGFIFFERSRRYIAPSDAARIARHVSSVAPKVKTVGVFVDGRAIAYYSPTQRVFTTYPIEAFRAEETIRSWDQMRRVYDGVAAAYKEFVLEPHGHVIEKYAAHSSSSGRCQWRRCCGKN